VGTKLALEDTVLVFASLAGMPENTVLLQPSEVFIEQQGQRRRVGGLDRVGLAELVRVGRIWGVG
jgi:hypothetical protein